LGHGFVSRFSEARTRPFLEKPFDNEPLSLGNTEAIQQISRAAGKPVLAVLSDGSMYGMGMEKPTLLGYERRNLGNRQVVDGWLVYTAPDPLAVRSGRIDRRVVQAMFARAKDANPLDAIARAAVEHKTPIEGTHFAQYLRLAGAGHIVMNQELLRLYGALTNAERQALRDGPVKVGALGAAAFNEAKNALMRDRTLRTFDAGQGWAEPTELTDAAFRELTLRISLKSENDQWFVRGPNFMPVLANPLSMARHQFFRQHPDLALKEEPHLYTGKAEFGRATLDHLAFSMATAPKAIFTGGLQMARFSGPFVTYDKLPASVNTEAEKYRKRMADDYAKRGGGGN